MPAPALGQQDLVATFRELGLAPGDGLIVHSSLRSLARVDGGAGTVIKALLETIGPEGNLMLPTFNYARPAAEPHFDPGTTPVRTGVVAETGRQWPGAIRSLHPTHSVAVIGPDADRLTRGHLEVPTVGIGSPLDRLAQMGGKVLLIGVGHVANTTVHIGEAYAGLPKGSWFDVLPSVKVKMPDGSVRQHQLDTSPSCSAAFGAVELALRQREKVRDARVADCLLQLARGADVVNTVREMIEAKPDVLLCTKPDCKPCQGTRRNLRKRGGL